MKSLTGCPRTPQRPQLTPGLFQTGDHEPACYPLDSQVPENTEKVHVRGRWLMAERTSSASTDAEEPTAPNSFFPHRTQSSGKT